LFVYYNTIIFFYENRKRLNMEPITIRWSKDKPDMYLYEGGEEGLKETKTVSGKGTPLND